MSKRSSARDVVPPTLDEDAAERKRVLNILAQRRYRQFYNYQFYISQAYRLSQEGERKNDFKHSNPAPRVGTRRDMYLKRQSNALQARVMRLELLRELRIRISLQG